MKKVAFVLSLILLLLPLGMACDGSPKHITQEHRNTAITQLSNDNNYIDLTYTFIDMDTAFMQEGENFKVGWNVIENKKIALANGLLDICNTGEKCVVTVSNISPWLEFSNSIVAIKSADASVVYLDFETGKTNFIQYIANEYGW